MANYHEFDPAEVQAMIDAAGGHPELQRLAASPSDGLMHASTLTIGETCISVTVENGKVCLKLPVIDQSVCLPVPSFIPDGTVAQACLKICTKLKIPTGVCVSVRALDKTIVQQCFGIC